MDELLSHSFEEIKGNGELIIKLLQLSQDFLNLSYTDCEKQQREYYEKLKMIKPMKQKTDYLHKKYILKPGKVLYYNHTHFNNDTLTDRMAAAAIKKFPALIGAFLSEKERAILETKTAGTHNIAEAENSLADEQFEKQIIVLIDDEKFDEARELSAKLLVEETRETTLKAIEEAEVKKLAAERDAAAKAKAKRLADKEAEAKKLADKEAEVKKLADEKAEAKKTEAEEDLT